MISLVRIKIHQRLAVIMVASIWCAAKVVTRAKDYGSSQPDLGKEPDPPRSPLRIEKTVDKPEVAPRIPKGVLNCLGHNPNARAAQNYSIVKDLGQTPCAMHLNFFIVFLRKGKLCFVPLG